MLRLPNGGGPFQDYLTSIGLKSHFPLWSAVLLALLAYATWAGSQLLVVRAFGWFGGIDHPSYLAGWLRGFDSGIFEEICVRGVILAILLKRLKEWPAILISAALFGLGHLIRILLGSPVPYELIVLSYTFLGGIFWAYIVVKTGSLIPAIVLHILIDTTGFILVPGEGSIVDIDTMFLIRRLVAAVAVLLVCMVIIPLLRRGGEDPHRDSLRTEEPGEAAGWRTG